MQTWQQLTKWPGRIVATKVAEKEQIKISRKLG